MATSIESLVDRVIEAYPPERLEDRKRRMRSIWDGRMADDAIPYVFRSCPGPIDPDLAACAPQQTHEQALLFQLGQILDRAGLDEDYVPGLFPGLRQLTVPSIFGATETFSEKHSWVDPIIREPGDVRRLPEPSYAPGTMAHFMLERARYFHEMTGGRVGVHIPDLQGAFSTASQLWGVQEFLTAIYEHPDELNELVRRTTDALVAYIRMFKDSIGDDLLPIHCMPEAWMPNDAGICISEDLIAVLSPAIFEEFVAPGLARLAAEFGACYAHSCGDIEHNLDALQRVPGLKGFNFSTSETDVQSVARRVGSNWMLMPHTAPVASRHLRLLAPEEHARLCFDAFREHATPGFVYVTCLPGHSPRDPEMIDFSKRLREWGAL